MVVLVIKIVAGSVVVHIACPFPLYCVYPKHPGPFFYDRVSILTQYIDLCLPFLHQREQMKLEEDTKPLDAK
jgi:hypothetical protein